MRGVYDVRCDCDRRPLRRQLLEAQEVDPGTGSTFEAQAARRLILRRGDRDPILNLPILSMQMPLPPGTLRAGHWHAPATGISR